MVIKTPDRGENLKIWSRFHSVEEVYQGVFYALVPPYINRDQGIQTHTCIFGQHECGVEGDKSLQRPEQENCGPYLKFY